MDSGGQVQVGGYRWAGTIRWIYAVSVLCLTRKLHSISNVKCVHTYHVLTRMGSKEDISLPHTDAIACVHLRKSQLPDSLVVDCSVSHEHLFPILGVLFSS